MSFKFLTDARAEFDGHVRPEFRALAERLEPVTWAEWQAHRMNSYERRIVACNLNDEALALCAIYAVDQEGGPLHEFELASSYRDATVSEWAPAMAERLLERALAAREHACDDSSWCPLCRRRRLKAEQARYRRVSPLTSPKPDPGSPSDIGYP